MIRNYQETQQVLRKVEDLVHRYLPDFEVKLVGERTRFWGAAIYGKPPYETRTHNVIELNRALIEQGSWEEIQDAVVHEIAHVLESGRYNVKVEHSNEWRDITRALGGSGMPIAKRPSISTPTPRYRFRCAICGFEFHSPNQHSAPSEFERNHSPTHKTFYVLDEITGKKWVVTRGLLR